MAINTQYKPKIYISDGETRRLNFDFFIFKKENLKIKLITLEDQKTIELNYGYDYTLEAKYDYYNGGWVILNDELKLTKGDKIILYRDTDQTQEINLLNLQTISPKNLTSMFDKLTALVQENKDEYYRSLKYDYEELSLVNQDKPLEEYNLRNLAVDNITKTVALTLSPDTETNQWLLTTSKLDPDRTLDVLKATEAEAIEGINDKKYITPKTVNDTIKSYIADTETALTGEDNIKYITPKTVNETIKNYIATQEETTEGINDIKYITPNTLKTTTDNRLDNYTKETIITNTIFQYKAETIYGIGQPCYALVNNEPIFYYSIKDNNIDNNPIADTEGNYWKQLKFGGDGSNLPIGSIITSTIPITDANLHLPDGAKLSKDGSHKSFYDYMSLKLKDKANINIVGTLTNKNNIIEGFSDINYALIQNIPNNIQNFEFVVKFTTSTDIIRQQGIIANSATNKATPQIIIVNNNINVNLPKSATEWSTELVSPAEINTTYWVKFVWDGQNYSLYKKTSIEDDWYLVGSESSSTCYWVEQLAVGCDQYGKNTFFDGSIDLNESYIKINNEYWWKGTKKEYNSNNGIFCTEEEYEISINSYGNCGKYVITDEYIRLPTINGWIETTTDINNNGVTNEAGLPNITGKVTIRDSSSLGAFYNDGIEGSNNGHTNVNGVIVRFDASRCSNIYGNSNTVTPRGVKYLVYIVIGNELSGQGELITQANQIIADIDLKQKEQDNKIETTLNNVVNTLSTYYMPDYNKTIKNVGNNYTAPMDGYFLFNVITQDTYFILNINNTEYLTIYNAYGVRSGYNILLSKGDNISITSTKAIEVASYFIPLKGVSDNK